MVGVRGRLRRPRTPTIGEVWRGRRPLQTSPIDQLFIRESLTQWLRQREYALRRMPTPPRTTDDLADGRICRRSSEDRLGTSLTES